MGIYSANRTNSYSTANVVADESYTSNDFNRILCESAINDQIVFESLLANDFREIHAIKEGTLLESEIKALNEKSVKELFASLAERVKKWLSKILGALKSAKRKLTAFFVNNGKGIEKKYKDAIKKYGSGFSTNKTITFNEPDVDNDKLKKLFDSTEDYIRNTSKNRSFHGVNVTDAIKKYYGELLGTKKDTSAAEFKAELIKGSFNMNRTVRGGSEAQKIMDKAIDYMKSSRSAIKSIDECEKHMNIIANNLLQQIKNVPNDTEGVQDIINTRTMLVSFAENVGATLASTAIKMIKMAVNSYAKYANAYIALMKHNKDDNGPSGLAIRKDDGDSTTVEEAAVEADAEFEDVVDSEAPDAEEIENADEVDEELAADEGCCK